MLKTHKVIDQTYPKNEGDCFIGTKADCEKFKEEQNSWGFEIIPLTEEEIQNYPDNQEFLKEENFSDKIKEILEKYEDKGTAIIFLDILIKDTLKQQHQKTLEACINQGRVKKVEYCEDGWSYTTDFIIDEKSIRSIKQPKLDLNLLGI